MINPEFSNDSNDEIDAEFAELIKDSGLRFNSMYATESLATEKDAILNAFVDHLIELHTSIPTDGKYSNIAIDTLAANIKRDFECIPGLGYGDEIIASGRTIALALDQIDVGYGYEAIPLLGGKRLRGIIDDVAIFKIPLVEDLKPILQGDDESNYTTTPVKTNEFGLSLQLINASIEDGTGTIDVLPEDYAIYVPLNYPELHLDRVIHQEIV